MNKIYQYRIAAGLSKTDLAQMLGVTPGTIYRWESKGHLPSETNINRINNLIAEWEKKNDKKLGA